MATIHGINGSVQFGGAALMTSATSRGTSWSLDTTMDAIDDTGLGNTFATNTDGLIDFTATVEGNVDSTGGVGGVGKNYLTHLGSSSALALYIDSNSYFTGTAIFQSFTETCSFDDVAKISINFEGDDVDGLTATIA